MRATRGIAARYIKATSSRKGSRPLFPGPFPVRDTFSKIGVPTEEQAKACRDADLDGKFEGRSRARIDLHFSLAAEAAKELVQKK